MKKVLFFLLIALLILVNRWNTYAEELQYCLNCGEVVSTNYCPDCGHSNSATLPPLAQDETYLHLKINYEKNKVLAKYDVEVTLDGELIGVIKQNEALQKLIVVKRGIHEIRFGKKDDHSVGVMVDAQTRGVVSCTLKAHTFSLEMKDLVNECEVSTEAWQKHNRALFAADCKPVDYERFCRYPEEFKDQKAMITGRVISTAENFAGAMRVVVKDSKNNLWVVEYLRIKTEPRLLVNDNIVVYGVCKGITDYTSSTDEYPNLPTMTLSFMELK